MSNELSDLLKDADLAKDIETLSKVVSGLRAEVLLLTDNYRAAQRATHEVEDEVERLKANLIDAKETIQRAIEIGAQGKTELEVEVERLKEFIRTAGEGSGGACKLDHWAEYQARAELDTQPTPEEVPPADVAEFKRAFRQSLSGDIAPTAEEPPECARCGEGMRPVGAITPAFAWLCVRCESSTPTAEEPKP